MQMPVIDSAVGFLEQIFSYEMGTPGFYLSFGACVLVWLVVARILMSMFSSQRGILAAICAFVVTFAIGLLAYGMTELHLVPMVEVDWAADWLPLVGLVLFVFLAALVIAKRIMDINGPLAVFIFIVSTGAAVGAYFGVQVTMGVIEYGEGQVEQREERVNKDIDAIL